MNILVAGGAGYIGSNMTAMLAKQDHRPIVLDDLSKGHRTAVGENEFVEGDLGDYELVLKTLREKKIEAVIHFGAFIEVSESVREPLKYYLNNVANTRILLLAMERLGIKKFVFSSTAAVYGMPEKVPVREDSVTRPINPYGQTKLSVENFCHDLSAEGELRYAALRYFNAAGAGNDCTLGEDHRPESHLIPLAIQAAMGRREGIKIFGTDYETDDGTCVRDYIHIEDLCRAHLVALDKLENATELIYNLGNGKGYSVRQVIDTVKNVSGRDFKVTETRRRTGDPAVLTADASKAQKELGWKPKYPLLEAIVETAWKWHNKYPDGYPD